MIFLLLFCWDFLGFVCLFFFLFGLAWFFGLGLFWFFGFLGLFFFCFFLFLCFYLYSFNSVPKITIELSLPWLKKHALFLSKKQTKQKARIFIYNFSIYKTLFCNMANCYPDMTVGNIYNSVKWDWLILTCFSPNFL